MSHRTNTPLGRIGYVYFFQPRRETGVDQQTGQQFTKEKYGCQMSWDQSVQEDLQRLMNEAHQVGVEAFGDNFWALVQQRTVKWPFRDGNEINPKTGQPRFGPGITFANFSSRNPVEVVSKYCDPADPQQRPVKVTDPSQVWPGEYAKCNITIKAYKQPSWGIGLYVNGCQIWHQGDKFAEVFDAQSAFDAEGQMPQGQMPAQGGAQQPPGQPQAQPEPTPQPGPTAPPQQSQGQPQGGFQPPQPQGQPGPAPGGFQPPQGGGGSNLL